MLQLPEDGDPEFDVEVVCFVPTIEPRTRCWDWQDDKKFTDAMLDAVEARDAADRGPARSGRPT
jgi:hypothetical protein